MSYAQARADFEHLETIAELDDNVEIDAEMRAFMRNPTKAFAQRLYENSIRLWLGEADRSGRRLPPSVAHIRERYQ